jgi:integrase
MSIYRRGEVWWCEFTITGKRTRESARTGDRKQAQKFHDALKAKAWRESQMGEKPAHTWEDACVRWLREKSEKRDYAGDCQKIAFFNDHFAGKLLTEITGDLIYEVIEKHKGDQKPSTKNRYSALARAIMRRAWRWGWIDPGHVPFVNTYDEKKFERKRFLEPEELSRLLKELPEHLRDISIAAVATGLRMSNVIKMRWPWVNSRERTVTIPGTEFKNGEDHVVPLNDVALGIIERQAGKHGEFVFVYRGNPVQCASNTAWYKALKRAGLEDVRFHDLRRTFASYLIQNGATDRELQELGGWKSPAMVRRYAQLRAKHLAPAARIIDRVVPVDRLLTVV